MCWSGTKKTSSKANLFSLCYIWKIVHLALNNNLLTFYNYFGLFSRTNYISQIMKLDQSWMWYSLDDPLHKLCLVTLSNIQDGHPGFWLVEKLEIFEHLLLRFRTSGRYEIKWSQQLIIYLLVFAAFSL